MEETAIKRPEELAEASGIIDETVGRVATADVLLDDFEPLPPYPENPDDIPIKIKEMSEVAIELETDLAKSRQKSQEEHDKKRKKIGPREVQESFTDEKTGDPDLVRLYLNNIGAHPLLTKDDEVNLAKLMELGSEAEYYLELTEATLTSQQKRICKELVECRKKAKDEFVKTNLRLVVSIAKRYQATKIPLLDLIQEGNDGLMHATEKFDWRKGFKFSTYATWWIRQSITRGIANKGRVIRLPVHVSDDLSRMHAERSRLTSKLKREPTNAELAEAMDVKVEKLSQIRMHSKAPKSLDEPLTEDENVSAHDILADRDIPDIAESYVDEQLKTLIADAISELDNDKEKDILISHFGFGTDKLTLDQIGGRYGLTRERIRQIESKALEKLKNILIERGISDYL